MTTAPVTTSITSQNLSSHPNADSGRGAGFAAGVSRISSNIGVVVPDFPATSELQTTLDASTREIVGEQSRHIREVIDAATVQKKACANFCSLELPAAERALQHLLDNAAPGSKSIVAQLLSEADPFAKKGVEDLAIVLAMGLEHGDDAGRINCQNLARELSELIRSDKLGQDSALTGAWRDGRKARANYATLQKLEAKIKNAVGYELRQEALASMFDKEVFPAHVAFAESLVGRLSPNTRQALYEARGTLSAMAANAVHRVMAKFRESGAQADSALDITAAAMEFRILAQSIELFRDITMDGEEPVKRSRKSSENANPMPSHDSGAGGDTRADGGRQDAQFSPRNIFNPRITIFPAGDETIRDDGSVNARQRAAALSAAVQTEMTPRQKASTVTQTETAINAGDDTIDTTGSFDIGHGAEIGAEIGVSGSGLDISSKKNAVVASTQTEAISEDDNVSKDVLRSDATGHGQIEPGQTVSPESIAIRERLAETSRQTEAFQARRMAQQATPLNRLEPASSGLAQGGVHAENMLSTTGRPVLAGPGSNMNRAPGMNQITSRQDSATNTDDHALVNASSIRERLAETSRQTEAFQARRMAQQATPLNRLEPASSGLAQGGVHAENMLSTTGRPVLAGPGSNMNRAPGMNQITSRQDSATNTDDHALVNASSIRERLAETSRQTEAFQARRMAQQATPLNRLEPASSGLAQGGVHAENMLSTTGRPVLAGPGSNMNRAPGMNQITSRQDSATNTDDHALVNASSIRERLAETSRQTEAFQARRMAQQATPLNRLEPASSGLAQGGVHAENMLSTTGRPVLAGPGSNMNRAPGMNQITSRQDSATNTDDHALVNASSIRERLAETSRQTEAFQARRMAQQATPLNRLEPASSGLAQGGVHAENMLSTTGRPVLAGPGSNMNRAPGMNQITSRQDSATNTDDHALVNASSIRERLAETSRQTEAFQARRMAQQATPLNRLEPASSGLAQGGVHAENMLSTTGRPVLAGPRRNVNEAPTMSGSSNQPNRQLNANGLPWLTKKHVNPMAQQEIRQGIKVTSPDSVGRKPDRQAKPEDDMILPGSVKQMTHPKVLKAVRVSNDVGAEEVRSKEPVPAANNKGTPAASATTMTPTSSLSTAARPLVLGPGHYPPTPEMIEPDQVKTVPARAILQAKIVSNEIFGEGTQTDDSRSARAGGASTSPAANNKGTPAASATTITPTSSLSTAARPLVLGPGHYPPTPEMIEPDQVKTVPARAILQAKIVSNEIFGEGTQTDDSRSARAGGASTSPAANNKGTPAASATTMTPTSSLSTAARPLVLDPGHYPPTPEMIEPDQVKTVPARAILQAKIVSNEIFGEGTQTDGSRSARAGASTSAVSSSGKSN